MRLVVIAPRAVNQRLTVCVLASPLPEESGALGATLGAHGIMALSRAFFDDTWASVAAVPWAEASGAMLPDGEGSAARLVHLLGRALDRGAPALAVLPGGPGVPRLLLDGARVALGRADAVLGPREGGGLYLLGLSRPVDGLLDGISLDDRNAFGSIRDRLRDVGFAVEVLAPWLGVAEPTDLARLRRALDRGEVRAPATARRLALPRISVVVPACDQEHRIASALGHLTSLPGLYELLVVDGQSRDRTASIARRFPVRLLRSRAGRAAPKNTGARAATGDVVWFVPPDVEPPRDSATRIADALIDPGAVGGGFQTWTVPDTWRPWFGPFLHAADIAGRFAALPRAEQALFARTDAFRAAGGFPELPVWDDLELARKLSRLGRLPRVPAKVLVSSERLHEHPLRHAAAVAVAPLLRRAGLPDHLLARLV